MIAGTHLITQPHRGRSLRDLKVVGRREHGNVMRNYCEDMKVGDSKMIDRTRYPIGIFEPIPVSSIEDRDILINQVTLVVPSLRKLISHLTAEQLQTPYRVGGWSIRQIIHHMADNDMNAYLRFKRALTETEPLATSYREDLWGSLHDYFETDIETSLLLLESLHKRFYILLYKLNSEQFSKTLRTQALGLINLDTALQRFIWHNHHHRSQIVSLINREAW